MSDLTRSDVVREWEPGVRNLCRPPAPDPCECGFDGDWDHRWVMVWHDAPSTTVGPRIAARWLRDGLPYRAGGWWVIGGYDERCPGCGDIERFDLDARRVASFVENGTIISIGGPR